jgi:hypothetical protein
VREYVRLFRSLRFAQALGLELAWALAMAATFLVSTWMGERSIQFASDERVAYSVTLRWDLGLVQVAALALIVAAPLLLWLVMRDPTLRDDATPSPRR